MEQGYIFKITTGHINERKNNTLKIIFHPFSLMTRNVLTAIFLLYMFQTTSAQSALAFADSVRKEYNIPELGYAVISSSSVYELHVTGVKKINSKMTAELSDRFRIGSNTKTITGFIAAQLVKQHKIQWSTKFFDLFPELKAKSNPAYHDLTLLNLLSFRTKLFPYTYTYAKPTKEQFTGNEEEQRYQFTRWFFQCQPLMKKDSINFSNLGYTAAGLMLEKASGKSYKQLVYDLGDTLGIKFEFGSPNSKDTLQVWGHDRHLNPEQPGDSYKLNWLLPAGNINVSLPGYAKFIQLQLLGLKGQSELLSQKEFYFLHYGLAGFSVGWFWQKDENNTLYSYHVGNPGTFLTKVFLFKDSDKAFILFSNAQTSSADAGLNILYDELKRRYRK
jgi:CubicO group peptidase (beta-lactamase class C family)